MPARESTGHPPSLKLRRTGSRLATADCSNEGAGGKPIRCAMLISKYAVGAQEENEFWMD
jgi:hypothetical protein